MADAYRDIRAGDGTGPDGDGIRVDGPGGAWTVLREAVPGDEGALSALFEGCEDWFVAATGLPSAPGDVQSLYYALPEGADPDGKRVLVVEGGGGLVGVVDVVLGHPGPDGAAVGLFLLAPEVRRTGLGSELARALLERAAAEGVRRVTATVPPGWAPGAAFLSALGFTLGAEPAAADGTGSRAGTGNRRPGPREGAVRRAELRLDG
ncbi:GNAT family N-acetyltransferase [Streptomyces sp. TS71-3]|uniref:GNAT family N-acetyltransferase n=1 Tax=Streptomyces sp. TS71-3 TaxID=2733862 RepID=UPI001BB34B4A|nr:GNAT family N-acetyltransferase [Streptomyces sp. TS71-3]